MDLSSMKTVQSWRSCKQHSGNSTATRNATSNCGRKLGLQGRLLSYAPVIKLQKSMTLKISMFRMVGGPGGSD